MTLRALRRRALRRMKADEWSRRWFHEMDLLDQWLHQRRRYWEPA